MILSFKLALKIWAFCICWTSIGSIYQWQKGSKLQTIRQEQSYLWIASYDGPSVKVIFSSQTWLCSQSQWKSPLHPPSIATAPPTRYSPLGQSRLASAMIWFLWSIVWCQLHGSSGRLDSCPVWCTKEGAACRKKKPRSCLVYSSLRWSICHGKGAGLFLGQNRHQWGLVCQISGSDLVLLILLCRHWWIFGSLLLVPNWVRCACCCCVFKNADDWLVYLLHPIFLLIIMFSLSLNFVLAQLVGRGCFFCLTGNAHGDLWKYLRICSTISCLLVACVVGKSGNAFTKTGRMVSFEFRVISVNFNDWLRNSSNSCSPGPRTEIVSMYNCFATTNCQLCCERGRILLP